MRRFRPSCAQACRGQRGQLLVQLLTRARVIVHDKLKVKREDVDTYEKLADPVNKEELCIRSGSHPVQPEPVRCNGRTPGPGQNRGLAQRPGGQHGASAQGGDTDQIKGVASGECGIAVTNTYYLARMMRSSNPEERAIAEGWAWCFQNQASWGTHVNTPAAQWRATPTRPTVSVP